MQAKGTGPICHLSQHIYFVFIWNLCGQMAKRHCSLAIQLYDYDSVLPKIHKSSMSRYYPQPSVAKWYTPKVQNYTPRDGVKLVATTAKILSGEPVQILTTLWSHSEADVRAIFKRENSCKASSPDGTPVRMLKTSADQLTVVFKDIFNFPLLWFEVPTCFKRASIVPVPKKSMMTCLNDYHPVALVSTITKCFNKLVKTQINSSLWTAIDCFQSAYHHHRLITGAIQSGFPICSGPFR